MSASSRDQAIILALMRDTRRIADTDFGLSPARGLLARVSGSGEAGHWISDLWWARTRYLPKRRTAGLESGTPKLPSAR